MLYAQPGALWTRITEQTQYALGCGALQPISTRYEFLEHQGIPFLVRVIDNLLRKATAQQKQSQTPSPGQPFNPFLPYDTDLFVADLSETHLCLLNKFNVMDHHILIVTRDFEDQETWLNPSDFRALWQCLREIDGLAFYNGGKLAGASQRHKHLQLVPLPLVSDPLLDAVPVPIALVLSRASDYQADLPFVHAVAPLPDLLPLNLDQAAQVMWQTYCDLLHQVKLLPDRLPQTPQQTGAYNWLMTREWMMVVPRSQEEYQSIAINALGFAGALLVRDQAQLQLLHTLTPLNILKGVGLPWTPV